MNTFKRLLTLYSFVGILGTSADIKACQRVNRVNPNTIVGIGLSHSILSKNETYSALTDAQKLDACVSSWAARSGKTEDATRLDFTKLVPAMGEFITNFARKVDAFNKNSIQEIDANTFTHKDDLDLYNKSTRILNSMSINDIKLFYLLEIFTHFEDKIDFDWAPFLKEAENKNFVDAFDAIVKSVVALFYSSFGLDNAPYNQYCKIMSEHDPEIITKLDKAMLEASEDLLVELICEADKIETRLKAEQKIEQPYTKEDIKNFTETVIYPTYGKHCFRLLKTLKNILSPTAQDTKQTESINQ